MSKDKRSRLVLPRPSPMRPSGRRRSSAEPSPAPAKDLGVKLGECARGRGQELRFRWRVVERDDGTFRAYLELRLWNRAFDGWFPSRLFLRIRPTELETMGDAVADALELADEFTRDGGAA